MNLAHNHPSGVADPSQADELITLRLDLLEGERAWLAERGACLKIETIDS